MANHRPDDLHVRYDAHELGAVLGELEQRGGNIAELTPLIAEDLAGRVLENLELSRGHKQGAFPGYSENNPPTGRRAQGDPKLLQDTGHLANIQQGSDATGAEAYSPAEYVVYHVSHKPRRVIPLRDIFDIDFEAATAYAAEVVTSEFL